MRLGEWTSTENPHPNRQCSACSELLYWLVIIHLYYLSRHIFTFNLKVSVFSVKEKANYEGELFPFLLAWLVCPIHGCCNHGSYTVFYERMLWLPVTNVRCRHESELCTWLRLANVVILKEEKKEAILFMEYIKNVGVLCNLKMVIHIWRLSTFDFVGKSEVVFVTIIETQKRVWRHARAAILSAEREDLLFVIENIKRSLCVVHCSNNSNTFRECKELWFCRYEVMLVTVIFVFVGV
jgi:hypothetical protein